MPINPSSQTFHAAVPGQNNLGLMYSNGWGVPQDYAEAIRWYRLAASSTLRTQLYEAIASSRKKRRGWGIRTGCMAQSGRAPLAG